MSDRWEFVWLIEAPYPAADGSRGYVRDIDTAGTFDVYMTTDPDKAMRFASRESAQSILNDSAFVHAMGTEKGFVVAEHGFLIARDN
jgi:hypothetical protein